MMSQADALSCSSDDIESCAIPHGHSKALSLKHTPGSNAAPDAREWAECYVPHSRSVKLTATLAARSRGSCEPTLSTTVILTKEESPREALTTTGGASTTKGVTPSRTHPLSFRAAARNDIYRSRTGMAP